MAQKIRWLEPEEDSITEIEISRSETKYGTYTVINTIDAKDNGSWVTEYTDITGQRTHWYRIRFYDNVTSLWSQYSDPITSEEMLYLCSVEDVKQAINTVGRWTDDEIFKTIKEVDDLIYIEMGTPIKSTVSNIGTLNNEIQRRYYVGEENIYRVDRVFVGENELEELYLDDEYKVNLKAGMIEILPESESGVKLTVRDIIEIQYVPRVYHKLSLYRTCKALIETTDLATSGKISKELLVINEKLAKLEKFMADDMSFKAASTYKSYDPIYGVNRRKITQDFERNNYIGGNSDNW